MAFIVNIANKLAKRIPKSIFSLITSWILRIIRVQLRVQKLLNLKYSVGPELIKFHANIILSRMTKVRLIERGLANIHRIAKLMVTPKAYSSIISNLKWYFPYLFDLLWAPPKSTNIESNMFCESANKFRLGNLPGSNGFVQIIINYGKSSDALHWYLLRNFSHGSCCNGSGELIWRALFGRLLFAIICKYHTSQLQKTLPFR